MYRKQITINERGFYKMTVTKSGKQVAAFWSKPGESEAAFTTRADKLAEEFMSVGYKLSGIFSKIKRPCTW